MPQPYFEMEVSKSVTPWVNRLYVESTRASSFLGMRLLKARHKKPSSFVIWGQTSPYGRVCSVCWADHCKFRDSMRIDKYQNIPTSWYSSAAPFPSLHISTNGGSFSSRVVIQHDRTNTHQQHTPCSKWWSLLLFFFRLLFSLLYIDITLVSLMVMELFYRYFHLHHAQCNYEIPATFIVQCTMPNRTVPPHEVIIYPQQKKML